MSIIHLNAKANACRRTKTRIGMHGQEGFLLKKEADSVTCLDGNPGILLEAIQCVGKENWLGWFPLNEIEIQKRE